MQSFVTQKHANLGADSQTTQATTHTQPPFIPQSTAFDAEDMQFSDGLFDFMDPNFDLEGIDSYLAGTLDIIPRTSFTGL